MRNWRNEIQPCPDVRLRDAAILAGTTFLKRWLFPDVRSLFCSEMVRGLYADLDKLPGDGSVVSPAGLEWECRHAGLCEKPVRIK